MSLADWLLPLMLLAPEEQDERRLFAWRDAEASRPAPGLPAGDRTPSAV